MVCPETPFNKNPHLAKISQSICFGNQLYGFYMIRTLTESIEPKNHQLYYRSQGH